jgi:serine/threonine protein kinase
MNPTAGTVVARRFQLVRELGRGSMGTVWLADHKTLGLRCAVKFTTAEAERDPAYRERFEREARAVAQLDCPNVVRVLDFDVFEGVPFLAMEWLSGEDLETRLQRVGRLGARDVHRIVTQIANGLERAHSAGIIHRDLKPGNVFLAESGDGEVAKILDFGLAKMASSDAAVAMTQAGSILGTPVYMSPEQARGLSDVDERSDLWSLAVIAYECLIGKLPFDGPSLGEVFARIMFEPIPVPSAVDPHMPPAFDRWWARATCRDVEGRFASAREMADALGQALGVDDSHSSKADLASVRTVRPPPRGKGGRWLVALAMGTIVLAGAQFAPNFPHLLVPPVVREPMSSALRAMAQSVSRLASQAAASMPSVSPPSSAAPDPSLPLPSSGPPAMPTALSVVISPVALAAPPTTLPPSAVPPTAVPASPATTAPSTIASVSGAPADPVGEGGEPSASGAECRAGQHRCDGRVLQVCSESRDAWANVTECEPGTVCDATGSGGCAALGAETRNGGQSTSAPAAPSL